MIVSCNPDIADTKLHTLAILTCTFPPPHSYSLPQIQEYLLISVTVFIRLTEWLQLDALCILRVAWSSSSSKHVEMLGWRIKGHSFPHPKSPPVRMLLQLNSLSHSARPLCVGMDGITDRVTKLRHAGVWVTVLAVQCEILGIVSRDFV